MTIKVGDTVPGATMYQMIDGDNSPVSTDDIFKSKRVALFALPGAFTPTCSAHHLPGYVVKSDELFAKGIDSIVCLSVNDAFVMHAWGEMQNAEDRVMMIGDGNGEFTKALGLDVDFSGGGMGIRSSRYSMVVNDGVVEHLNIEAPKEFAVSDADTMLGQL